MFVLSMVPLHPHAQHSWPYANMFLQLYPILALTMSELVLVSSFQLTVIIDIAKFDSYYINDVD